MTRPLRLWVLILSASVAVFVACRSAQPSSSAQEAGDHVRLKAFHALGVPLHPASGDNSISGRLPDGTVAKVLEKDPARDWIKVEAPGGAGWITLRYVGEVVPAPSGTGGTPAPAPSEVIVGCWNLEHFKKGAVRGFPENTQGGPSYPPRTQHEIDALAGKIQKLGVKILVLSEIGAQSVVLNGESEMRSAELDLLVGALGAQNFAYVVGRSGGTQHLAILYDTRAVRLNGYLETDFPEEKVDGKSLFDRQPLIAHLTLLKNGQPMNDLAVVGLHLASGQQAKNNHDLAMRRVRDRVEALRSQDLVIPKNERDVLICGDFNANRFDTSVEKFWEEMEAVEWDVLADDVTTYPVTRMSGVPLGLVASRIDYVIVSKGPHGLQGDEVAEAMATVHTELIEPSDDPAYSPCELFRRLYSDHLPVTVKVRITADTDP